jgi:hypothetical protein
MPETAVLSPFEVDHASDKVSKNYLFIPTAKVIEVMADHGWALNSQAATKSKKHAGYQKHMCRFRPMDPKNEIRVGDSIAELLAINSHNGSTSWRFSGGVWRIVCGNGLIVSELQFPGVVARHHGDLDSIIQASLEVADRLPMLVDQVNRLRAKQLTPLRAVEFARDAGHIRYDNKDVVDPKDLLHVRREEDAPTDLWTIFNRVQENLSRGGQVGQVGETGMFRRMRPMGGMDKTIAVNTALWDLAVEYAA